MKNKKKLIAILCVMALLMVSIVGCGNNDTNGNGDENVNDNGEDNVNDNGNEESASGDLVHISLGTTGSGGADYIIGGSLASVLNRSQDIFEISPIVTAGAGENPILVNTGAADLGVASDIIIEQAYHGEGDFREPMENIRRLFTYSMLVGAFIVSEDSGIESFDDIYGMKLNIGLPVQTTRDFNNLLFFDGMGLEAGSDFEAYELSTGDAFDALRNGIIDGTNNLTFWEQASVIELATEIDIRMLDMPDDVFDAFNEVADGLLFRAEIPAGMYPGIDEPVQTWANSTSYIAHKDMDEDLVYEFTKAFWENIEALQAEDAGFTALSLEEHALVDIDVPLHPGAERYFREQGLID